MITSASNSYTIRMILPHLGEAFPQVLSTINNLEGRVGAIDIVKTDDGFITRDITIDTHDEAHANRIYESLKQIPEVNLSHMSDRTFMLHLGGKIEMKSKLDIKHRDDLSMVYTPGLPLTRVNGYGRGLRTISVVLTTVFVVPSISSCVVCVSCVTTSGSFGRRKSG